MPRAMPSLIRSALNSASRANGRLVILMTMAIWGLQFVILAVRAEATGGWTGPTPTLIRFGSAVAGFATTLLVSAILRDKGYSPARAFLISLAALAPLGSAVVFLTQMAWLFGTDFYQTKFDIGPSEVFAQPASLVGQLVHTAESFVWVYVAWAALFSGICLRRDAGEGTGNGTSIPAASYIWVKEGGVRIRIPLELVDWAEAAGDFTVLHCGSETHVITELMGSLARRVDPDLLIRVHRSTMVNPARIRAIRRRTNRPGLVLVLSAGNEIIVGPKFVHELQARIEQAWPR